MSFFDCYLATKKYKNSRSRKFWGPFFLVAVYPQKIEPILISSSYGMTMKTYIICFQFPTRNLFQSLGINRGQSSYSQMSSARGCEESPPKRIEFSFHEINSQKVIGWVGFFATNPWATSTLQSWVSKAAEVTSTRSRGAGRGFG